MIIIFRTIFPSAVDGAIASSPVTIIYDIPFMVEKILRLVLLKSFP